MKPLKILRDFSSTFKYLDSWDVYTICVLIRSASLLSAASINIGIMKCVGDLKIIPKQFQQLFQGLSISHNIFI